MFSSLIVLILSFLFQPSLLSASGGNFLSAEKCSTPKVIVMIQIGDNAYEELIRDEHFNPKDVWSGELGRRTVEKIKAISGGVTLNSIDEIVRSVKDDEYYLDNNPEMRDALRAEYLFRVGIYLIGDSYSLFAYLTSIDTTRIVTMKTAKGKNIYDLIDGIISQFGDLYALIRAHEMKYPVPPRDPSFDIRVEPEEIWPEPQKDKCRIKVILTHCNGLPVYTKFNQQKVFFREETARGKVKTEIAGGYSLTHPGGKAEADYSLEYAEGTDPGIDTVEIWTYGRGRKKFETTAEVEIAAERWEGVISSSYETGAQKDRSLITAILPEGEYQGMENWTLQVMFQRVRSNERIKVYEAKSAELVFKESLTAKSEMENTTGDVKVKFLDTDMAAEIPGRPLGKSECRLEMIIDLKRKTYRINGIIDVAGIPEESRDEFEVKAKDAIRKKLKESETSPIDFKEEISLQGEFKDAVPEQLAGNRDMMKEIPAELLKILEGLAGEMSWRMSWKLRKAKEE